MLDNDGNGSGGDAEPFVPAAAVGYEQLRSGTTTAAGWDGGLPAAASASTTTGIFSASNEISG